MSAAINADVLRALETLGISEDDALSIQDTERAGDIRFTTRKHHAGAVIEVRSKPKDPSPYSSIRLEPTPMSATDLAAWAVKIAGLAYLHGVIDGEQREARRIRADLRAFVDGGRVVPRPEEDEGPDEARH